MRGVCVWLALALLAVPPSAVRAADAVATAEATQGGTLWLRPNPDAMTRLGLRPEGLLAGRELWEIGLLPRHAVRVELADGAPTRVLDGAVAAPALRLRRSDGRRTPALTLVPDPERRLDWNLVDSRGDVWLRITHGMRSPDRERDGLRVITADLRVGPGLAAFTDANADDLLLANASLRLPLGAPVLPSASGKFAPKSCAVPNWPSTPGFVTDVALVDMSPPDPPDRIDVMRCRSLGGGSCDGPGGDDGEVVITPSATLRNRLSADAADVPWRTKFSGVFPPYNNDQHPFLVWSMYRLDDQGRIEQIGQSGVKHAFATANEFCQDATCPFNGNILGRACQDVYNAASNDYGFLLSPRAEVIPSRGIWGRCGSVYDDGLGATGAGVPGCDGVQDAPPTDDLYRHRLVVRESTITASDNPGAVYLIDAWYVVRDDENIYNTMGYRSLAPQFDSGFWKAGALGAFRQGAVIDRWLELAPEASDTHRSEAASAEGHAGLATRVTRLQDGRWRYDYALMNFDFSRAVTDLATAEPNLRILSHAGYSAMDIDLVNGASIDASEFRDGDAFAGNDWNASTSASAVRLVGPGGATLEWGRLLFVSLTSTSAPGDGQMRLEVALAGDPAFHALPTLVPDAAKVFRNSFE